MAETINTQTTGYECVGIEKIEQTYEGLFDNKPNIITIYLTNGDTHQFKVMNGSQGVGIDRIEQRQSSTVSGGRNEFAIILTNGKEYTFSTYNGSGGSGSSGSFNQVLQHLNNMLMPSGKSYLYYNGSGFEWKSPDGSTGGGTADLSEYSWWGRKFDPASKMITGEMSAVTSIEFQSTKGETTIRKKLYLDENGDLCFNGNLYATGGITALGSGGGTSGGGSGVSLGTLLTKLNSENPFPTASGQVLTYDGSNFVWKTSTGSGGSLKPLEVVGKDSSTFFVYNGETRYRLRFGSGLSMKLNVDEYVVTADGSSGGSGGSGSIQVAQTPEYAGGSESWVSTTKLRFVGITGTKPTIRTNSEKSCVDVGIPVGSGSDSSGTTSGKLRFYKDSSEESWNGESDFKIIFGSGLNVTWDSTTQITLSATGGSSGGSSGGSVSWTDVTGKPSTFTPSSHTHSTSDINGLNSYVKGTKVSNASAADRLANAVTLWGNSFSGNNSIGTASSRADLKYVKDIYAGDTFDIKAGNNSVLKVDGAPNIYVGFGYMANAKASLLLFGNKTTIYTSGDDYRYDFKDGVFDVNTNTIHFGPEAGGGKISWDRANNAFKIEGNVYATGGITALGVNSSAITSNNLDFTFKSVTITGNNNVQLTDDGLQVSKLGDKGAWYKKDSIIMYNENDDDSCEIFHFDNNQLSFDPNLYQFDIRFNNGIECNTVQNSLKVGTNKGAGFIEFTRGSTMKFEYDSSTYTFNVENAIRQGILKME